MADPKTVHFAKEGEPSMKASIYEQYTTKASDMKIASNIALPQDLKPDHVLVKVKSSSINPVDYKLRHGDFKLAIPSHFPKITGRDLSGIIEKVGSKVTKFKIGDEVYGMAESIIGTNCEYVNCSERSLAKKPASLNWHEAAGVPLAALTAWEGLKDHGNLEAGKSCLIFGGSSGVGHFAVQMAKIIGATVWATCGTSNVDYVKSLGADHVIDYKKQDFTKVLGEKVDLVFDVVGNKNDRDRSFEFLKPHGVVVTTTPNNPENEFGFGEVMRVAGDMIWKNITHIGSGIKYKTFLVKEFSGDQLQSFNEYFDSGKIKIRIDSVMSLYQIVEAHEKIESGKAQGKIIIEISQ